MKAQAKAKRIDLLAEMLSDEVQTLTDTVTSTMQMHAVKIAQSNGDLLNTRKQALPEMYDGVDVLGGRFEVNAFNLDRILQKEKEASEGTDLRTSIANLFSSSYRK